MVTQQFNDQVSYITDLEKPPKSREIYGRLLDLCLRMRRYVFFNVFLKKFAISLWSTNFQKETASLKGKLEKWTMTTLRDACRLFNLETGGEKVFILPPLLIFIPVSMLARHDCINKSLLSSNGLLSL